MRALELAPGRARCERPGRLGIDACPGREALGQALEDALEQRILPERRIEENHVEALGAFREVVERIAQNDVYLAGTYELAPGRVILIAKSPSGAIYLDHAANRMGVLYPIGERTFVSGPSLIAGFPV